MSDEKLKAQLELVQKEMRSLHNMLNDCDAKIVRVALEQADEAIRPLLYAYRTDEERQKQKERDMYC